MKVHKTLPQNFWINTNKTFFSEETLVLVYLIDSPHTNRLGCFRLPLRFIKSDLNYKEGTLTEVFQELIDNNYLIWDDINEWGYLTHFLEWFPIQTYYQARNLEKDFDVIPKNSYIYNGLVKHLLQIPYLDRSFRRRLQAIWMSFKDPSEPIRSEEINARSSLIEPKLVIKKENKIYA